MKLGTPLDANQQELKSAVTHKLAAAPGSPVAGQRYYDTTMKAERIYDGATWVTVADITYVNPSAPAGTPNSGDLWWDSDDAAPGITTPLGVTDGGTGATSPGTARASLAVPGMGNSTTTAGAPTAGTWARGDQWLDSANVIWLCITAGTPGVWTRVSSMANTPQAFWHAAIPAVTVNGGTLYNYDFSFTLPRAGFLIISAVIRWYMAGASASSNVVYMQPATAPGGPVAGGYDHAFQVGPFPTATQSGGTDPLIWNYASAPAGTCPCRFTWNVSGTAFGVVLYVVQAMAVLI